MKNYIRILFIVLIFNSVQAQKVKTMTYFQNDTIKLDLDQPTALYGVDILLYGELKFIPTISTEPKALLRCSSGETIYFTAAELIR
ncbi:hypothetical protein [Flavobacterium piscis]|uniref:Urease accessory protein UreE n=1 Tax=Flavobacterium piscis TaxID=1114874 RepID=A0ABU1YAS1_9FLAO|nr:hypothetical protein [Flavobacterium piscis]MDR7211340.1 urease accessory protein UreE [Flavobacterium piscis]